MGIEKFKEDVGQIFVFGIEVNILVIVT